MRCRDIGKIGHLLREVRERQGISQRRLARRAGTSQDAISRIERGVEVPTLERFAQLMLVLGWRPTLDLEPLESSVESSELAVGKVLSSRERLREAMSWNLAVSRLAAAGERARREGRPAVRRGTR